MCLYLCFHFFGVPLHESLFHVLILYHYRFPFDSGALRFISRIHLRGRVKVVRLALEEPTDEILTSMQGHLQYVKTSTLQ